VSGAVQQEASLRKSKENVRSGVASSSFTSLQ
jgi:hypothetical protein